MKNPFLLFSLFLFSLLMAFLFSNPLAFGNRAMWCSFVVLAYIFYYASFWMSLGTAVTLLLLLGPYTGLGNELIFFISLFYGAIRLFQIKVLRPAFLTKVLWVFVLLCLFFLFLERDYFLLRQNMAFYLNCLLGFSFNFLITLLFWWFLEKGGARLEEKYCSSRDSENQLNLFTVQQMKVLKKSSHGKLQVRIRRRFGLKDSW